MASLEDALEILGPQCRLLNQRFHRYGPAVYVSMSHLGILAPCWKPVFLTVTAESLLTLGFRDSNRASSPNRLSSWLQPVWHLCFPRGHFQYRWPCNVSRQPLQGVFTFTTVSQSGIQSTVFMPLWPSPNPFPVYHTVKTSMEVSRVCNFSVIFKH